MNRPDLPVLTTLRFPAAFIIVVYHFLPKTGAPLWSWQGLNAGVSFFYVLSGFILYYNYSELKDRGYFWIARVARVWPMHLVTALLAIVVLPWTALMGHAWWPITLPANLFLLQAWIPFESSCLSFNGVSASLSVEAFFYLMFPWLLGALKRRGAPVLLSAVFAVGFVMVLATTLARPQNAEWVRFFNPIARLFEFTLGMVTARLWMGRGERAARAGRWNHWEIFLPIVCVTMALGIPAGLQIMGIWSPLTLWLGTALNAVSFACLIWIYAHQAGALSKILSARWLTWLGEISFAVYMLHQIILSRILVGRGDAFVITDSRQAVLIFAEYVVVTLAFSAVAFYLVETPIRHGIVSAWKKRFAARPLRQGLTPQA